MLDLKKLTVAAAFASLTSASMLLAAATAPTDRAPAFGSIPAIAAFADEDGERGGQPCINPAGNERGFCKHGDDENGQGHKYKHRKHRGHRGSGTNTTINGTVLSVNGNTAQIRLDDGRVIAVDEAGVPLNVGQHYSLSGCYQNGTFVVNCNGYGGNANGSGYGQQQVSGTILSVSGNIVTLAALPPVRIDIGQAQANGRVSVALTPAQHITAYGYNQNGTFFATSVRP